MAEVVNILSVNLSIADGEWQNNILLTLTYEEPLLGACEIRYPYDICGTSAEAGQVIS